VLHYARDAIASGETRETTIRRLRALGLCPQGFFDECDWHVLDPLDEARTNQPPPRRATGWVGPSKRNLLIVAGLYVVIAIALALRHTWIGAVLGTALVAAWLVPSLATAVGGLWLTLATALWHGSDAADPNARHAPVTLNPQNPNADYDKLPSGTVFVGPDGVTRRKP
jgi:hypothetical protein